MNKKRKVLDGEMYVLYVDIMGFKSRVDNLTHENLSEQLCRFRNKLISWFSPFTKNTSTFKIAMFSDSILIVDESGEKGFNRISRAAAGVMSVSLKNGFPIKGCISKGKFCYNSEMQLFFGKALVDAYLLHEELSFYGIVAHHSIENDVKKYCNSEYQNAWVKSPIALKRGPSSHYHIAYNLVSRAREVGMDTTDEYLELLEKIEETVSGTARIYVDKTREILRKDRKIYDAQQQQQGNSITFPIKEEVI